MIINKHTYNFGIIGNCTYLGYINTHAEVVWLCMPRFDSSFIFGSLLDTHKGGEFSVKPAHENFASSQYYIPNTNVLCTEFTTNDGSFRVIDFAPRFRQYDRYFRPLMFIRKIELLSGNPFIKAVCTPVGAYGTIFPEVVTGSNHIQYLNLGSPCRLTTDVPVNYILHEKPFLLSEDKYLVFTYGAPLEAPLASTAEDFLVSTIKYWQAWIKSTSIRSMYQEQLIRSALVLKLHQYEDTGGIIASGTTSLPEYHLSTRNWDYRYCWMRDTYYTLNALNSLGHFEESELYFHYIENIILSEKDRIQPLYTIIGDKKIHEIALDLDGYLGNKPVRIGNEAYTHIQNDVYGQVLVSLLPMYTDKRLNIHYSKHSLQVVEWLLDRILLTMNEPDAGLWEFRNRQQLHCYTFLFHWAGAKAAYKIAKTFKHEGLLTKSLQAAKQAAEMIEACYDPQQKAYTQAVGVSNLDASGLQLITMNYLNSHSTIAHNHIVALENALKTEQGLFYRYVHEDDFGKPEATFLVCAFWYVEALACVNRIDDAINTFENLLQFSNHLGIFSEDVDTMGGQWGNFPQTYSHVGLMNAAFRIARKLDSPVFL